MLVDADVKVAQGALQTVTGDLAALLGRPPTTLREAVTTALRH
jgi:NAD(P)H dehydrogenase (quinone)